MDVKREIILNEMFETCIEITNEDSLATKVFIFQTESSDIHHGGRESEILWWNEDKNA